MLSKSLAVVCVVLASIEKLETQLVDGSGQFSQFSVVKDKDSVNAVFSDNSSVSPTRTWGRTSGVGPAGLVSPTFSAAWRRS